MRTTWTGVPKELREAATPLLTAHARLVPGWCKLLTIRYDDDMADANANVSSEQIYGRVTLTFGPGWLNLDEAEREWTFVHELYHTQLSPLERAMEEWLTQLPAKMRKVAEARFDGALEEAVSGLAYALVKEGGE